MIDLETKENSKLPVVTADCSLRLISGFVLLISRIFTLVRVVRTGELVTQKLLRTTAARSLSTCHISLVSSKSSALCKQVDQRASPASLPSITPHFLLLVIILLHLFYKKQRGESYMICSTAGNKAARGENS